MTPLSSLESRCFDALQAFQRERHRQPTYRELTEAAGFNGSRQTRDVLHRIACKGWIESEKLPGLPRALTVLVETTAEPISETLRSAIVARIAKGESVRSIGRQASVQHVQIDFFVRERSSLRLEAVDGLCVALDLGLSRAEDDASHGPVSTVLRAEIRRRVAPFGAFADFARASHCCRDSIRKFLSSRGTLDLTSVDRLCRTLGLRLSPPLPPDGLGQR